MKTYSKRYFFFKAVLVILHRLFYIIFLVITLITYILIIYTLFNMKNFYYKNNLKKK